MTLPANFTAALPAMTTAAAAQGTDYKALVFVYLAGGNDCHNTVIPVNGQYAGYAATRGFLALPNDVNLKTLTGQVCKLNPNMPKVAALFNASKCAIVANVGTLAFPLDGAAWGSLYATPVPVARPRQLFSHSDQQQQWQSGLPEDPAPLTGWGGRAMDLIDPSFNPSRVTPSTVSVAGRNMFMEGYDSQQYQVATDGAALFVSSYGNDKTFLQSFTESAIGPNLIENEWRNVVARANLLGGTINTAIAGFTPTGFPATVLGSQLKMVAQLIRARSTLGHRRDIFFVNLGGFDTHTNQLATHPALLAQVDDALDAFYQSTLTLGAGNTDISRSVTTFTGSDFGRSLVPNSSGSDHGWGGHHFVIGGDVKGQRVIHKATAAATTVTVGGFPDISIGGPNDSTEGRLKPTISVDEYASTLLKWFGVPDSAKALMIPNLSRFTMPDLDLMGAPYAAPVFSAQSHPGAIVGGSVTYTYAASDTTSYAVFSGSLPAGRTLNTATGVVSGTYTTAATSTYVIRATGPGGFADSTTQSVVVAPFVAGTLSAATTPYTALNVTTAGFIDWIAGQRQPIEFTSGNYEHKGTVNAISTPVDVNLSYAGNGQTIPFSWNAGDTIYPNALAGTQSGSLRLTSTNPALVATRTHTFPAGTVARKARVYLKTFRDIASTTTGVFTLRATMSDGSIAPLVTTITPSTDGLANWAYEFTYTAGSAGQTLSVSLEIPPNNNGQLLLDLWTYGP